MREFHRPVSVGDEVFDALPGDIDPAERAAAGHRVANLLVRGPHGDDEQEAVERILHLADEEGLGVIAELWSHASAESVAGALWRLYVLRTWVHRNPVQAAAEYQAGKTFAPVHEVLAGVVDPPGPDEVILLVDTVVRGIAGDAFDVTLDRAASFAYVVGTGRANLEKDDPVSAAKLVDTAKGLHRAANLEREGRLH